MSKKVYTVFYTINGKTPIVRTVVGTNDDAIDEVVKIMEEHGRREDDHIRIEWSELN